MEYITKKFENTHAGIREKDEHTRAVVAQGFRIVSEHVEPGHVKGDQQCCLAMICLPFIFLAGRTPGTILVTYGRETSNCKSCGGVLGRGSHCHTCGVEISEKHVSDESAGRLIVEKKREAAQRTAEINNVIRRLENILISGVTTAHKSGWESLIPQPCLPQPQFVFFDELPPPRAGIMRFLSKYQFIEKLFPAIRTSRLKWEEAVERNSANRVASHLEYSTALKDWSANNKLAQEAWEAQRDLKKQMYSEGDLATIIEYSRAVLRNSEYPISIPESHSLCYSQSDETLIVDFALPDVGCLPLIGEVKYLEDRNSLQEVPVSEIWRTETYTLLIIRIALRTLHELFQSDTGQALNSIVFNGRLRTINRSTGREICPAVISIEALKSEFSEINLEEVDPEACFRRFDGRLSDDPGKAIPITPLRVPSDQAA